ncbi:MAG: plasmid replication protein RepC [Sulfitobacter sp.]
MPVTKIHNSAEQRQIKQQSKRQQSDHPQTAGLVDKWKLLTALTEAAEDYGLNHRTLCVLRALLGFHPDRMIACQYHSTIVFPANRTLSERLGGMPESTLRRHLAALVSAGIVSRHDSANRKRYARGRAEDGAVAFGFDLSAFARLAQQITAQAQRAAERRSHLQALRAQLAALRQDMMTQQGDNDITAAAFRLLRRKPDAALLTAAIAQIEALNASEEMSACVAQNERHIQGDSKILSEDPRDQIEECTPHQTQKKQSPSQKAPAEEAVVAQCKEYQALFPETVHDWQGLSRTAYALAPMMGIERSVYAEAIDVMGPKKAIAVLFVMLEGLETIGNPGGYLRRLSQQFRAGAFDMAAFVRRFLSNTHHCQLTT